MIHLISTRAKSLSNTANSSWKYITALWPNPTTLHSPYFSFSTWLYGNVEDKREAKPLLQVWLAFLFWHTYYSDADLVHKDASSLGSRCRQWQTLNVKKKKVYFWHHVYPVKWIPSLWQGMAEHWQSLLLNIWLRCYFFSQTHQQHMTIKQTKYLSNIF